MKSYTDFEQSKKLAEILPLKKSADMRFCFSHKLDGRITGHYPMIGREPSLGTVPCWSLAALLDILPKGVSLLKNSYDETYAIINIDFENEDVKIEWYNSPIDACYEMIIKLHEQKIL